MFVDLLIKPFNKENSHSYQTYLTLYERARELALFEGASEAQAATFAAWCATLAGHSEPHPLCPPIRVEGLNRLFVRKSWAEYYCDPHKPKGPCPDKRPLRSSICSAYRSCRQGPICLAYHLCIEKFIRYIPRLQNFFDLEGDYEAGFRAVFGLIRRLVPF